MHAGILHGVPLGLQTHTASHEATFPAGLLRTLFTELLGPTVGGLHIHNAEFQTEAMKHIHGLIYRKYIF
jgi:hypothetical protein